MDRTILHCDLNGFYASVECLFHPELKKVPMAVAGNPKNRHGIILAKNELAKGFGIKTAETVWQAKKKCPELILVSPRRGEYSKYSKLVNGIYNRYTNLVEPFGIDESWLDITGVYHLSGSGFEVAEEIRGTVHKELGLTISVGVSWNKIFAKLGSDYKKPDATTIISRENYMEIAYPLPVTDLLFVGKSAADILGKLKIRTIGDLARSDREVITSRLGKMGSTIWGYANGLDDSPVAPAGRPRESQSIGNGMTFKRDLLGMKDIRTAIFALSDEVAYRMRKQGVSCRVIAVTIKNTALKTISRQRTLPGPTHLSKEIAATSIEIIKESWNLKKPIRMLSITGSGLTDKDSACEQITLFADSGEKKKQERLESAMDKIREKYGKSSLTLGSAIDDDLGTGALDRGGSLPFSS